MILQLVLLFFELVLFAIEFCHESSLLFIQLALQLCHCFRQLGELRRRPIFDGFEVRFQLGKTSIFIIQRRTHAGRRKSFRLSRNELLAVPVSRRCDARSQCSRRHILIALLFCKVQILVRIKNEHELIFVPDIETGDAENAERIEFSSVLIVSAKRAVFRREPEADVDGLLHHGVHIVDGLQHLYRAEHARPRGVQCPLLWTACPVGYRVLRAQRLTNMARNVPVVIEFREHSAHVKGVGVFGQSAANLLPAVRAD